MKVTAIAALALVASTSAFVAPVQPSMSLDAPANRMNFIKKAVTGASAAAVGVAVAAPVFAEVDNPVVPLLGGGDKVDLNNANVRAYIRMPGMYPNAAGKIVSNGPYSAVSDVYNIKGLSDKEKAVIKKYESKLVVTDPQAMYVVDRINNGLYR